MKWPTPYECLVIHASIVAAQAAAFAPLFDNDPAVMGANGFMVGVITGSPVCVLAEIWRRRR